jgi:D-3-phosphoglycerate dehydrogenase
VKVLVRESIGESGVQLLRDAGFEVEVGTDWDDAELDRRIGEFSGILIRSATQLDADLLAKAHNLKAVGRAGVGVDNVDVEAATKRGVVVANAPQSNVITAAEHTIAMLLALARNLPQAHGSLIAGQWERSRFSGVELYEKTLGVLGFGRVGQLVAQRAISFGMHVVAFDVYVAEERFRDLGVERADSSEALYAQADFITIHLPVTAETENWLDAEAFARMKDGVRVINVARGKLMVEEDLRRALDSGKVAGAALDVFREEPLSEHPLFAYPNVVVTPHLGASTAEATDRAGYQAAEQVVAALTAGVVTSAVNVPAIAAEDVEVLGPFLPLARDLGRVAVALAEGTSVDALEVEYVGRIAERDTRLLTVQVLKGALSGHTEEEVNDVNAPAVAEERGIHVSQTSTPHARDFTDLVRVTVVSGGRRSRVDGTILGRRHRAHLLGAWGSRFNVELEPHLAIFRYEDRPGMLGRVGTELGNRGINIISAAVGRREEDAPGGGAVMLVTADSPVPQEVVDGIVAGDGFHAGRTISL